MEVLGACPLDCPDGCSWVVTVQDGQAARMRGNPDHPYTRGALCVKVNRYLEHASSGDRLRYPLRRTGPKGSGRFERISWDDALSEIAVRLRRIVDEFGGEAIWPYYGTGSLGFVQGEEGQPGRRLFNLLGASHHDANICSAAGNAGLRRTLGTAGGMDPETFAQSRLILLWGTNPLTTGHHLWKYIQAADAHVVAIDPIRTRSADRADEHLAIRPGTDAALAMGLLNVVVSRGMEDRDYIAARAQGWETFRSQILKYTPSRVASITGIPAAQIEALGTRLAFTRPTGIRATQGLQRHAGGGTALRTLACIPGVTGDWQYPGGGLVYSTSGHAPLNTGALFRDDLLTAPVRTLRMTRLGEGLLDLADPPVKALFVIAANPMGSTSHQNKVRQGLARDDLFTVVMEQFPTDTVDYADIVLPSTMQHEHMDLHTGYGHLYLQWNEPAVAPAGECLPATETFRRLSSALGLTEPSLYDDDLSLATQALSSEHPSLEGITLDRLRKEGWVRLNYPTPFVPFTSGFPTPSGRLEFPSASEEYVAPVETLDGGLALISPASHTFLNTIFGNNPELRRRAGEPHIEVNPSDASARGLADGQRVRVFNDRGAFEALVVVSDRVRQGVVASPKGHWPKLSPGGANTNATVDERDADMAYGAVYHDNRVELAPL